MSILYIKKKSNAVLQFQMYQFRYKIVQSKGKNNSI